jgi:hypothetical protein
MNQPFNKIEQDFVLSGNQSLSENIKILLYQTDSTIFDRIDFNNEAIYKEPLLFAYFKSIKTNFHDLDIILYGYTKSHLRPLKIQVTTDEFGKIYLPNIGWLITDEREQLYDMIRQKDKIALWKNNELVRFTFEPIELVRGTNIELLKYSIPLLKQFYYDVEQSPVEVEIANITQKHKKNLRIAWNLIKDYVPNHYKIITETANRSIIFNVDTYLSNSFATLSAQGIGFFNAYQNDYNEVFFVDDIAHQTGHIIFNAMIYDIEKFLLIAPNTILQNVLSENDDIIETRDVHVIFHALYTYYTTFTCLDACLDAGVFKKAKKHEALGRMLFYIEKCYRDMSLIEQPTEDRNKTTLFYTANSIFTTDGLIIYNEIKNTFKTMANKWGGLVKDFDMSNQPYNFTYSKFIELNPYK